MLCGDSSTIKTTFRPNLRILNMNRYQYRAHLAAGSGMGRAKDRKRRALQRFSEAMPLAGSEGYLLSLGCVRGPRIALACRQLGRIVTAHCRPVLVPDYLIPYSCS